MRKIKSYIIMLCCLMLLYGCSEDNQPPARPEVVEPEPGSVVSLDVTLRWTCEDPDGDMLTYNVYISDYGSSIETRLSERQISNWYKPGPLLDYGKSYTWRVTAWDSEGNQSKSRSWTFTTEAPPPPPTPPSPIALVNEAVTVAASSYRSWELSLSSGWRLSGQITSDTDVNIWLLSAREFEAFKKSETFYSISAGSRKRTIGFNFTYKIPETQKYHFVVDNRFSWITSKNVWVYLEITQ